MGDLIAMTPADIAACARQAAPGICRTLRWEYPDLGAPTGPDTFVVYRINKSCAPAPPMLEFRAVGAAPADRLWYLDPTGPPKGSAVCYYVVAVRHIGGIGPASQPGLLSSDPSNFAGTGARTNIAPGAPTSPMFR